MCLLASLHYRSLIVNAIGFVSCPLDIRLSQFYLYTPESPFAPLGLNTWPANYSPTDVSHGGTINAQYFRNLSNWSIFEDRKSPGRL